MTYQTYIETVKRAAREAVDSSVDAHGGLVAVRVAWAFIKENAYLVATPWDEGMLPDGMPVLFAQEYTRYGAEIGAKLV
jgi:hypothetical protein